ncbi:MAG TPA: nucleotidyl transferase AbiEii/AbiGii toxin family protein [Actinospica sp.]|jgi:hypothetical protein|nr:nucleotidyl transferase AbiEii/AbiGii toxin family protein [Actinospica sp.]
MATTNDEMWEWLRGKARGETPKTLRTVYEDGTDQLPIFEPALVHFPNAYRAADPRFEDDQLTQRWLRARREALDLALAAVSGNEYAEHLMLRGSVLMNGWYPAAAREPGDLDFVVLAQDWGVTDNRTGMLFKQLARDAENLSTATDVHINASGAVKDDIWTYDRVPGRRLMLPWQADGLPGGWVQLDFVFGEKIHLEPERTEIALSPGRDRVPLRTASKELSLAWKIVWLLTDAHPQGKDLYDAVLLAEDTPLSYHVLRAALTETDERFRGFVITVSELADLDIDDGWDHFRREYPSIEGSAEDWLQRLCTALKPTFTLLDGKPATPYELEAAWLSPLVAQFAELTDDRGDELQRTLLRRKTPLPMAVLFTRELVGRERMSVAEAIRAVLTTPGRADEKTSYAEYWALERATRAYGVEIHKAWPDHLADAPILAQVNAAYPNNSTYDVALKILAPLATDPDPRLSDERVLSAVIKQSKGRLPLLHYAIQSARAAAAGTVIA